VIEDSDLPAALGPTGISKRFEASSELGVKGDDGSALIKPSANSAAAARSTVSG